MKWNVGGAVLCAAQPAGSLSSRRLCSSTVGQERAEQGDLHAMTPPEVRCAQSCSAAAAGRAAA